MTNGTMLVDLQEVALLTNKLYVVETGRNEGLNLSFQMSQSFGHLEW